MREILLVLVPATFDDERRAACRESASRMASAVGMPVEFIVAEPDQLEETFAYLLRGGTSTDFYRTLTPATSNGAAPMSSAPFIWREDGLPDWSSMWQSFCDLALYGGPPHRGDENALKAPVAGGASDPQSETLAEIRRGIWETTGLFSEPAEAGWISVTCQSPKMAAWLCACIILENVEARCEEKRLLLPASPDFDLKNEVKSVITVLAKTHHYWQAHVDSMAAAKSGMGALGGDA
jgi:sirohydrochlorin cobaltochelatase